MNRYQIQLDERTAESVRALARSRGESFAQVVREAVVGYLGSGEADDSALAAWGGFVGAVDDATASNVSEVHDDWAWDH